MKIVVLDAATLGLPEQAWEEFRFLGELVLHPLTPHNETLIISRCEAAEVVCTNKVPLSASTLSALPRLRHICVLATGYNIVDVAAAQTRGIPVSNVPAYSTEAVAQHVFALILAHFSRVERHDASVHGGDWSRSPTFSYWLQPLRELAGMTLGIVGFGTIGRRVGEIGHAFGMHILAESRRRQHPPTWPSFAWAEVDELFARSDIVSLHCPATVETTGLVNQARLSLMKPEALLVNTARGQLIDEAALARALAEGRLGGAALDVLSQEPPPLDHPLLSAPRCLLTPHLAWAGVSSRQRLLQETILNIRSGLEGIFRNRVA